MTDDRLPLAELLAKTGDADFLRSAAEAVVQLIMAADVEGQIGAGRHERTGERLTYRNGFRDRTLVQFSQEHGQARAEGREDGHLRCP